MGPADAQTRSRLSHYLHRLPWLIAALLLLLTLTGCLTSHASGPSEQERLSLSSIDIASPTASATSTTSATTMPGVTLLPSPAGNSSQMAAARATVTATATLTPTAVPDTVTPTPEPTATATSEPTATPTAIPPATPTPQPTNTPRPTTIPATASPFEALAWVDNAYPAPGSVVTVHGRLFRYGRPVNGAQMGATWSYTHGEGFCSAYTGIDGITSCAQNIGAPLQDYWVFIDVVFVYRDQLYYAKTGFLTDP